MRRRFVQINGELVEITPGYVPEPKSDHHVMPDIKPYQSMIDGSWITSRSQHRAHLKQHRCQEIGNETAHLFKQQAIPDVSPQKRRELIRAQIDAMSHREFRAALKRDIDRVKWNSRER